MHVADFLLFPILLSLALKEFRQKSAASNRYVKALKRLKHILSKMPGCGDA